MYNFNIYIALPVFIYPNNTGPLTAVEGSNVTLNCEATSNGTLTYRWLRASGSLPENAEIRHKGKTLVIYNIAVSDGGKYYCEVNDGIFNESLVNVQVIVKSKLINM